MLTKKKQAEFRSKLFQHLDGIVTAPTAYALKEAGITDILLSEKSVELSVISKAFNANEGYLNVALRILCSQGWLEQQIDNRTDSVIFNTNDLTEAAFSHFSLYEEPVALLRMSEFFHPRKFEMKPFLKMEAIFEEFQSNFGIRMSSEKKSRDVQEQILRHIEGVLLGPTLVHLGMAGMFHKYFMETRFSPEEFHTDAEGFERLLDILTQIGLFTKSNGAFEFTDEGLFFARRASAYGVTVSYIPTLRKLQELIFGDPLILRANGPGPEKHVDREMNVWGSGGAHAAYFKVVDEIIIDIFNKPIDEQPKGILDMGCGNGAFLQHLFMVIESQTLRGTLLDEFPLTLIGVDYNEAALKVSRQRLIQAEIWAKIIWGDIGKPDLLANDLQQKYGVDLRDLLNVRTFLDHNRIWETPDKTDNLRLSMSTGAYAYRGKRLSNNLVSQSLKQHFNKWLPYLEKHGLLIIELHTVNPAVAASNIGKTAVTAYDATHGYSDQYIIEVDEFSKIVSEIGLIPDPDKARKFPNSELATVTINLLHKK